MACKVEKQDIFRELKNELLNLDGVKPTPSGVFYSYNKDNSDNISKEVSNKIKDINKTYQSNVYGPIVETSREEYGVRIDINPSQDLADAMTEQNYLDESIEAGRVQAIDAERAGVEFDSNYLFDSRRDMESENPKPVGDNYMEFIRYKQERLDQINNEIARLKNTLKNNTLVSSTDVVSTNKAIKVLDKESTTISRQLEALKDNQSSYMFHAIQEDLDILEKVLKSDNIIDINKVNSKLTFLDEFISGNNKEFKGAPISEYNDLQYNNINGQLRELIELAKAKTYETARTHIESSSSFQNLVDLNPNLDTDRLFQSQKDLNWLEKYTLGVTADRTNNTIIPQSLDALFRGTLTKKQSTVEAWNKQLKKLVDDNPDLNNPAFIKEVDSKGDYTGFITDLFSPFYYKKRFKYEKRLSEYTKNPTDANYLSLLDEFLEHNEVIDFTKLRAVKNMYGQTYPEHFNSTEDEMDRYEENLKSGLGPRYKETIAQTLNRLALFEEKKVDAQVEAGTYSARDLATQDIWKFNQLMKGTDKFGLIPYEIEEGTRGVRFRDFNNVTYLPKAKKTKTIMTNAGQVVRTEPTGYYNEDFEDIKNDPAKLEYWRLVKNISEYVSSTFDQQSYGRLSYPKIQREYAERVQENIKDKNFGKVFSSTANEYKSWFYEKGRYKEDNKTIVANYQDTFQSEVSKLSKIYQAQGVEKSTAFTQARREILENYSDDFNSNLIAVGMEAAIHDARLEVQPMAEAYLRYFNSVSEGRTKAIEKLEYFYDKIILNTNEKYRESGKVEGKGLSKGTMLNRFLALLERIPYVKKLVSDKSTYLLSDSEKKIFKELNVLRENGYTKADYTFKHEGVTYSQKNGRAYEILEEEVQEITDDNFQRIFRVHIEKQISELGLDLNLAGLVNGILKTVIFKGLALNPISGIFNRLEGKHSSMIMDATNEYWTRGNIDVANNLMNFANITRLSRGRLSPVMGKRKDTLQTFDTLLKQFNILQDRKNELQRSAEEASFDRELLNPFMFAVENPEYKNQGAIVMAILMDHMVEGKDGSVPFLDKTTGEFNIYDRIDGMLVLKDEFRTPANEEYYEAFKGDVMENLVLKMTDAVSRSQGNYNSLDIMMVKKSLWGRAGTLFMTWFAEHINQRFGTSGDANYNLHTGKKRRDGRFVEAYKSNKANTILAAGIGLTAAYGLGGAVLAAGGVGVLGVMVYKKFVGSIAGPQEIKRDANYAMELIEFTKSLLVESLNYPGRVLNVGSKLRIKNNSFEKTNMSADEVSSMRAITRELSIVLSWLALKLAMGALLYEDDDDKDSPARMKHNFVQNQLSRVVNALTVYSNPQELITDSSRIAALELLSTAGKIVLAIWNEKQQEDLGKNLLDLTPIPRILTKDRLPWHDKMNYDNLSNFTGIPSPMKWTSDFYKDMESDNAYSEEREYRDILRDLREEYKEELMSKHKGKKKPLKKEIDALIKKKIGGYKKTKETYKEKLAKMKELGF